MKVTEGSGVIIMTNKTGLMGETFVIANFIDMGIPVYTPVDKSGKVDLLAYFDGGYQRIQVKSSSTVSLHEADASKGAYTFKLVKDSSNKNGYSKHIYTKDNIDYFALYHVTRHTMFLIPVEEAPTQNITFSFGIGGYNDEVESEYRFN